MDTHFAGYGGTDHSIWQLSLPESEFAFVNVFSRSVFAISLLDAFGPCQSLLVAVAQEDVLFEGAAHAAHAAVGGESWIELTVTGID